MRYPAHLMSGTPRTRSLTRATQLLQAIAQRPAGSSASELARATDQPRATISRTLRTLEDAGLVEETREATWVLGYELVRLARSADPNRGFVEAARPALAELRDATGESASVAVPRGRTGMEIVLQLDAERHIGVADWVGVDVPLHASSAGKIVLAELDAAELEAWLDANDPLTAFTERTFHDEQSLQAELARIRRQGWAELVDELEDGLAAISVPLRSSTDALIGIVGISGPTFRLTRARRRELLPVLRSAAAAIDLATR